MDKALISSLTTWPSSMSWSRPIFSSGKMFSATQGASLANSGLVKWSQSSWGAR